MLLLHFATKRGPRSLVRYRHMVRAHQALYPGCQKLNTKRSWHYFLLATSLPSLPKCLCHPPVSVNNSVAPPVQSLFCERAGSTREVRWLLMPRCVFGLVELGAHEIFRSKNRVVVRKLGSSRENSGWNREKGKKIRM